MTLAVDQDFHKICAYFRIGKLFHSNIDGFKR